MKPCLIVGLITVSSTETIEISNSIALKYLQITVKFLKLREAIVLTELLISQFYKT